MTESQNKVFEKACRQLPGDCYDWYVRLLPGCFGVALWFYLIGTPFPLTFPLILLFLILGYLLGHLLQPLSGLIVGLIENLCLGSDAACTRAMQHKDADEAWLKQVAKAHVEANSLMSFALALLVNTIFCLNLSIIGILFGLLLFFYLILAVLMRLYARERMICDLDPHPPAPKKAAPPKPVAAQTPPPKPAAKETDTPKAKPKKATSKKNVKKSAVKKTSKPPTPKPTEPKPE